MYKDSIIQAISLHKINKSKQPKPHGDTTHEVERGSKVVLNYFLTIVAVVPLLPRMQKGVTLGLLLCFVKQRRLGVWLNTDPLLGTWKM